MNFEFLNKFLAGLTLVGDIGIALFLLASLTLFAFHKKFQPLEKLQAFASENILLLGFAITLFGTVASLFYSEVAHLPPCTLCWYQRIFLFSQAILFGIAYARKDRNILNFTFVLTGIGLTIAVYHVLVQSGFSLPVPCSVNSLTSCATKEFQYFGFITIPVMSLTSYISLFILHGIAKMKK